MRATNYAPENMQDAARVYLTRHLEAGVDGNDALYDAVRRDLIIEKAMVHDRAETIAAMVVADHAAKDTDCLIDIDRSTRTCLFVTIDGQRHAVTVPELATLVQGQR